jgi:DNA-binding beta-propeller fold protein YncE
VAGIPASASQDLLFVACNDGATGVIGIIETISDSVLATVSVGSAGAILEGIAITAAGDTVFTVDSANDELISMDTAALTTNTFDPGPGDLSSPLGLGIHPVSGNIYIASSGDDSVVVVNVAAPATTVAKLGTATVPTQVAITPDAAGTRVFVTLFGSNSFAVFTDAPVPAAPTIITPAGGDALAQPIGITIPPLVAGPFQVFLCNSGGDELRVRDDTPAAFPANATTGTIALTAPAAPFGAAHIGVPRQ